MKEKKISNELLRRSCCSPCNFSPLVFSVGLFFCHKPMRNSFRPVGFNSGASKTCRMKIDTAMQPRHFALSYPSFSDDEFRFAVPSEVPFARET